MSVKLDLVVQDGVIIPAHELMISTSRAGGPGGQHVNKTESKVTIRWHIKNSHIFTDEQKERLMQRLHNFINADGELIVHNGESRSQEQNKKKALDQLAQHIRRGLTVPKIRKKTKVSKAVKEARLEKKSYRGYIKKMRSKKIDF